MRSGRAASRRQKKPTKWAFGSVKFERLYTSLSELRDQGDYLRSWVRRSFDVANELGDTGEVAFADVTSDLTIARAQGDRVDHARIVQTPKFATALAALHVNLAEIASLVPELQVTIIDGATGSRYRLRDPMLSQAVRMPQRVGG
jgi:hypothetical protein